MSRRSARRSLLRRGYSSTGRDHRPGTARIALGGLMSNADASLGMGNASHARVLSANEVHALSVRSLGLDAELLDLESPEAFAALVRRAASFAAPCSPRVLRDAVLQALDGLVAAG